MSKPDPSMLQAFRKAADSFNDLLQIVVLESELLAQTRLSPEETKQRLARIVEAARKAVDLSRSIFGAREDSESD